MWNLKNKGTNKKQKQTHKYRELVVAKEKGSGMGKIGEGD